LHLTLDIPAQNPFLFLREQASVAARSGLADGSFRKVEVTPHLDDAFELATERALEVIDISDTESM
jgi:hypothetical protein